MSYTKSLADICSQLTPAETFKSEKRLQGKETRQLLKKAQLWRQPLFTRAIVLIQAYYRGYRLRKKISLVTLRSERSFRYFTASLRESFERGRYAKFVDDVNGSEHVARVFEDMDLSTLYAKCLYALSMFDICSGRCKVLLEKTQDSVEVRYMLACCNVRMKQFDAALSELTRLIGIDRDGIDDKIYKLHAMVCTRIRPHRYSLAITDYDYLIALHAYDMNLVSHSKIVA